MRNDEGQVAGISIDLTKASNSRPSLYWLPTLRAKTASISLPLSRGGGQQLLSALLADHADSQRAKFHTLLSDEPSLALWATIVSNDSGQSALNSLAGLAEWLASRGPVAFDGISTECGTSAETSGKDWASQAIQSIAASRWAARVEGARCADSTSSSVLIGLLVHASEWLGVPADEFAPLLPEWLAATIAEVRARSARRQSTPAGCVAEALAILAGKAPIDSYANDPPTDALDLASLTDTVRKRWSAAVEDESIALPELIARLARLQRLESDFERQLEFEKIESLKELAYGAGHEINNPLANISARAQTLLKEESDPEKRRKLAAIKTQAVRAHEMIADMMLFARPPELQLEQIDAGDLLTAIVREFSERAAEQATALALDRPSDAIIILADRTQLAVAIRALVANACEALGHGGEVGLSIRRGKFELHPAPGDTLHDAVEIAVTDNGPGISATARQHLFDPYFSGREANRGIGFGLCKCWRIITAHGGRIVVESDLGKGARFGLILPSGDA